MLFKNIKSESFILWLISFILISFLGGIVFLWVNQNKSSYSYSLDKIKNEWTSEINSAFFWNKDSKVQLEVYLDLQCPACIWFNKNVYPDIKKEFIETNKIWITFKQFPLEYHKRAPDYANLSYCALKQNKYEEFKNFIYSYEELLLKNKQSSIITDELLKSFSEKNNVNAEELITCRKNITYGKKVYEDYLNWIKSELEWTPQLILNWKKISINWLEDLKNQIKKALN